MTRAVARFLKHLTASSPSPFPPLATHNRTKAAMTAFSANAESSNEAGESLVRQQQTKQRRAGGRGTAFTVTVEGNIGAGKTTFLDRFSPAAGDDVDVLPEPVDRWRDVNGHNLLAMMYEDPARHSLLFQTYVQLTMFQQHNAECSKQAKILERSLFRIDTRSIL